MDSRFSKSKNLFKNNPTRTTEQSSLDRVIQESWDIIAPYWPLENIIAVNPLQGLENKPFKRALFEAVSNFEYSSLPTEMCDINREMIKWCQAYFDRGQQTIRMPFKNEGFYSGFKKLAPFDANLHQHHADKINWLKNLPQTAHTVIGECLIKLGIPKDERLNFLTLILCTLPGWAAYVKYLSKWQMDETVSHINIHLDFLAIKLILCYVLWPDAKKLLNWHKFNAIKSQAKADYYMNVIEGFEAPFRHQFVQQISLNAKHINSEHQQPEAQFVFCIDVRSEPFRKYLEKVGHFETFGFAGFFGVPICVEDELSQENYPSCPVLLKPKHKVTTFISNPNTKRFQILKNTVWKNLCALYCSLKYNFTSHFALVETVGLFSGFLLGFRSLSPWILKKKWTLSVQTDVKLNQMELAEQISYAESLLRMIGLTQNFSKIIVICGHGSTTTNNIFETSLDCGACGGRHGDVNAKVLAKLLNDINIRENLQKKGIHIPATTVFLAALHDTTTDDLKFLNEHLVVNESAKIDIENLKIKLEMAKNQNSVYRCSTLGVQGNERQTLLKSQDWSQVRPEWGLAKNAAFVVGPRHLTKNIPLNGRCFLHSYDWQSDSDDSILTTILTAPMVVAEWINMQYLFSTLNNTAYGSGSKITQNVSGKLGVMQGNASDLMHGLPLQSVSISDKIAYHEPQRLMTLIYAPKDRIKNIILNNELLKTLIGNEWVKIVCLEPENACAQEMLCDFSWKKII